MKRTHLPLPDHSGGGNFYDKYGSRNPIERHLVRRFLEDLGALVDQTGASHIHEVGCGEGVLIASLARPGRTLCASDCSMEVIRKAAQRHGNLKPPIVFEAVALEHLDFKRHGAQLIICCEVLEHVSDPVGALGRLQYLAQPYLLASVPREPLWCLLNMLRLKYLPDFGNTPGHQHHWSTASFVSLLNQHFHVLEVRRPLPWTMALCRANRASAELHRARERSEPPSEFNSGQFSDSESIRCA
ncbi:MAG: methyltransferase domain-containing protein [Verrucomicrobia bacterium]|nr:methyltransferase domain-containing protein [Verrucomicrobiota bacterium]